tara:strand:- start:102 stop:1871 length:1770 start_codon:yes stop_codon:yes gene_type:complete
MRNRTQTTVIAELANAHQGSKELAKTITAKAKENGAKNIKFQVYTADELLCRDHIRYEHFKGQQFMPEEWDEIFKVARKNKLNIYCDIFGEKSLNTVIEQGIQSIKIHTSDMLNSLLVKRINEYDWDNILISTGGATGYEIMETVNMLTKIDKEKIVLMHGFQSYPTKHTDSNLNRIKWLKQNFKNCRIGYQDHSAGDSEQAVLLPQLAIAMGVEVIEKHITLNRDEKGIDWFSSINTSELKTFLRKIRIAEESLGKSNFEFSESEIKYRNSTRKQWFFKDDMKKEEVISENSLVMLRQENPPCNSADLEDFIGKKLKEDVYENSAVKLTQVENKTIAAIIVRTASNRLAGKALLNVGNTTCIKHLIERVKLAKEVTKIVVCTTKDPTDDYLVEHLSDTGIHVSRGETQNIVSRVINAVLEVGGCRSVVRITGDDIMVDPTYIDKIIEEHNRNMADYTSSKDLPSGTETEIFKMTALKRLEKSCEDLEGTEYLTYYIQRNTPHFSIANLEVAMRHKRNHRLTIDTEKDYRLVKEFIDEMCKKNKEYTYSMDDINDYFDTEQYNSCFEENRVYASKEVSINTTIDWKKLV